MRMTNHAEIEEALSKSHAYYVLITCDHPSSDGMMHVKMSYGGGDASVASYLLDGAQSYLEENILGDSEE